MSELMWCMIEYKSEKNGRFKGVVIVEAKTYQEALNVASRRELNLGGRPYVSSLTNEVMFLIPETHRWRRLNSVEWKDLKEKLDNYFEQVYV